MANKNHNSKNTVHTNAPAEKPKTPVVPASIAELKALSANLSKISDVPETMLGQRAKLALGITKLADRIHKGLGAAAKKAERDAAKKVREDAKVKRDATKKDKKLAAIETLKEKLAQMEADVAPADDKKTDKK